MYLIYASRWGRQNSDFFPQNFYFFFAISTISRYIDFSLEFWTFSSKFRLFLEISTFSRNFDIFLLSLICSITGGIFNFICFHVHLFINMLKSPKICSINSHQLYFIFYDNFDEICKLHKILTLLITCLVIIVQLLGESDAVVFKIRVALGTSGGQRLLDQSAGDGRPPLSDPAVSLSVH